MLKFKVVKIRREMGLLALLDDLGGALNLANGLGQALNCSFTYTWEGIHRHRVRMLKLFAYCLKVIKVGGFANSERRAGQGPACGQTRLWCHLTDVLLAIEVYLAMLLGSYSRVLIELRRGGKLVGYKWLR